jgi:hypothetical protein
MVKSGSYLRRVGFLAMSLALLQVPSAADACGIFDSSCKSPTISVRGQVFIAVIIVLILGGLIVWRVGKPRLLVRVMVWIENRRVKRAARRNRPGT